MAEWDVPGRLGEVEALGEARGSAEAAIKKGFDGAGTWDGEGMGV